MENQNKKNKIKEYYVRLKENYILRILVFAIPFLFLLR